MEAFLARFRIELDSWKPCTYLAWLTGASLTGTRFNYRFGS
ncbi:hypothetical protein ENHYD8BJ_80243 [Enhydrobacter sp. 8BJ]|nr:hypothetical protein ENHYD8BJ_80243 [Enhydrobacter sp. 8BJ]